jgi:hypothetical protein
MKPYYDRTFSDRPEYSPMYPTEDQIDTIRPLRPDSVRCLTDFAASDGGLWVRTCYDKELEQAHRDLWQEYAIERQALGDECPILEDEALFQGISIDGLLDIFPERVTDECGDPEERAELGEKRLARIRQHDDGDNGDDDESEEKELFSRLTPHEFQQEMCRQRYTGYHKFSTKTHVFIEDRHAQTGRGVLHVFLDDFGNVVRQAREDPESIDMFSGAWFNMSYDESSSYVDGEVRPAYLPRGVRRPPYG